MESPEIKVEIEALRKLKIYKTALEENIEKYKEKISDGKSKISDYKNTLNFNQKLKLLTKN